VSDSVCREDIDLKNNECVEPSPCNRVWG